MSLITDSEAFSYFNGATASDFFRLVCGNLIGKGLGREVFDCTLDPTKVLKVETGECSFQNIMEWQTWEAVKHTDLARWFAPCFSISACGIVLVQAKTSLPRDYPIKVPSFFTDIKKSNFGLYGGSFVAHDYGFHLLMEKGMSKRMKKANWGDRGSNS